MKEETEAMIRNLAKMDGEVKDEDLERAITILRGEKEDGGELIHVMKRKDVMKHLKIHRRTLDYYLNRGLLDRVYGGGRKKALGVSRESFLRFQAQRARRTVETSRTSGTGRTERGRGL